MQHKVCPNRHKSVPNGNAQRAIVKMPIRAITAEQIREEVYDLLDKKIAPKEEASNLKDRLRLMVTRTGLSFSQVRRAWYKRWDVPGYILKTLEIRAAEHEISLRRAQYQALVEMQKNDPDLFAREIAETGELLFPTRDRRQQAGARD
jgi:hypothetical protein